MILATDHVESHSLQRPRLARSEVGSAGSVAPDPETKAITFLRGPVDFHGKESASFLGWLQRGTKSNTNEQGNLCSDAQKRASCLGKTLKESEPFPKKAAKRAESTGQLSFWGHHSSGLQGDHKVISGRFALANFLWPRNPTEGNTSCSRGETLPEMSRKACLQWPLRGTLCFGGYPNKRLLG